MLDGDDRNNPFPGLLASELDTPDAGNVWVSFIKFDLSPFTGMTINSATLELTSFFNHHQGIFTHEIYSSSDDSWEEDTITGLNRPSDSTLTLLDSTNIDGVSQTYTWDVMAGVVGTDGLAGTGELLTLMIRPELSQAGTAFGPHFFDRDDLSGFPRLLINVEQGDRFSDVPTDYWAYSFIETLSASGITAGCGGGNYCPEKSVTRAQMAVFLERGMRGGDFSPPAALGNAFLDVGKGDFAASFIEQLASDGITAGCGSNNYCPDDTVTRDQMAVFLLRARHGSGYSPPTAVGVFDDVDLSHWAVHWIEQLASEGITSGCGANNYCPDAIVTRAQMAVFIVRTFLLGYPTVSQPMLSQAFASALNGLVGNELPLPEPFSASSEGITVDVTPTAIGFALCLPPDPTAPPNTTSPLYGCQADVKIDVSASANSKKLHVTANFDNVFVDFEGDWDTNVSLSGSAEGYAILSDVIYTATFDLIDLGNDMKEIGPLTESTFDYGASVVELEFDDSFLNLFFGGIGNFLLDQPLSDLSTLIDQIVTITADTIPPFELEE